jgi:hypothetical protein
MVVVRGRPPHNHRHHQMQQQIMRPARSSRRLLLPTAFFGVAVFATTFLSISHHRLHEEINLLRRHDGEHSSSASFLSTPHRRLRSPEHNNKSKPLQILSFGGTDDDSTAAARSSYDKLLSDRTISGSYNMDLAVACTQSIVGDAVEYDAITIPLVLVSSSVGGDSSSSKNKKWLDHTRVLEDRIRKRFPKAVIVLVELLPLAGTLTMYPTTETFQQWHDRKTADSSWHGVVANVKERAQAMIDDAAKVQGNWIWGYTGDEDTRLLERRRNDPLLVVYRLDPTFHTVPEAMEFLNLFRKDGNAGLSPSGHAKVANDIRSLIQSTLDRTALLRKDREAAAQLKSWGTGDDCHLWFGSGDYLPSSGQPLDLPQINPSSNRNGHKHALEFRKLHNDSISIHNPFPTDRMLFLTYMTDADSMDYSTTRVFVNGIPTVQIQPFHDNDNNISEYDILHVARTAGVGLVPPGASTVVLEPVTAGLPFWLVGASILAQEALELPVVEFNLERQHLLDTNSESSRLKRRLYRRR